MSEYALLLMAAAFLAVLARIVWITEQMKREERAIGEVAFLREQVRVLTEHRVRMERVEAGLAENVPPPKAPPETMPDEVSEMIGQYESGAVRDALLREIGTARKQGVSWKSIEERFRASLPPEE